MGAKEYEELVADICTRLTRAQDAKVHRDRTLVGRSGQEHQIDVVVELEILGVRVVMLVECKWWNQRVGLEEVMVLAGRLDDIGANKGIIVTTTGFKKGAFRLAHSKGIALVLCKDSYEGAEDEDLFMIALPLPSFATMSHTGRYSYYIAQEDGVAENSNLAWIARELAKEAVD